MSDQPNKDHEPMTKEGKASHEHESSVEQSGRSRATIDELLQRLFHSVETLSARIEAVENRQAEAVEAPSTRITGIERNIAPITQQKMSELDAVSYRTSLQLRLHPLCYLDFDHGRVVIELDVEECPQTSEFFLKIMTRQRFEGNTEEVVLKYDRGYADVGHGLTCNHPCNFITSDDKMKKKDGRSVWGIQWGALDGSHTRFWLSREPDFDYFGSVVEGEDVLNQAPGNRFVLKGYGIVG